MSSFSGKYPISSNIKERDQRDLFPLSFSQISSLSVCGNEASTCGFSLVEWSWLLSWNTKVSPHSGVLFCVCFFSTEQRQKGMYVYRYIVRIPSNLRDSHFMDYKWIIMITFMFYGLAYINGDTLGVSLSNHQEEVKIDHDCSTKEWTDVCLLVSRTGLHPNYISLNQVIPTVDGRNPALPGMYKALQIMG